MARRKPHRGRRRGRKSRGNWFSRLSLGKKIAVCAGGVLFCLMTTGVIYVAAKLGKIETEKIPQEDIVIDAEVKEKLADLGDGYLNVALFGVDSREQDLGVGNRTDCIIVASLNKETKEIKMVSVYRDTLLDLSEGTLQKCNAAYSFGGPTMAINMLNMNLDLDIQNYVTVDFSAIAGAIDQLGGVDIEVLEEEVEPMNQYIGETAKVAERNANYIAGPGMQHLDGVQATTYARIRSTAGGDFTRTERQRVVIEKMVEKVQKSDLKTINSIIDTVFQNISTNFTVTDILNYAKYFAEYKLSDNTGFPFDKTTDMLAGCGSVVIPVDLRDNVRQLHEFLFGTTDYSPSSTVQSIAGAIVIKAGDRQATSDEELNSQMYETEPEDNLDYTNDGNGEWIDPGTGGGTDPGTGGGTDPGTGGGTDPGTGGGTDPGTEGGTDPGTGGGTDPGTGGGTPAVS